MTSATARATAVLLGTLVTAVILTAAAGSQAQAPSMQAAGAGAKPIAVRNQTPQAGREVLILRHQQLKKGAHDDYYRASRAGVWPWYETVSYTHLTLPTKRIV